MGLRDNLKCDTVKALSVRAPDVLGADATAGDAVALMQERSTGCVIVTEQRQPVGIFTERDVLTRVFTKGLSLDTPLTDVMTPSPITVSESCSVASVIQRMHKGGLRHMPVVDADGGLQGIISVKRILEYLVEHVPKTVFNLPPEPDQTQRVREGA